MFWICMSYIHVLDVPSSNLTQVFVWSVKESLLDCQSQETILKGIINLNSPCNQVSILIINLMNLLSLTFWGQTSCSWAFCDDFSGLDCEWWFGTVSGCYWRVPKVKIQPQTEFWCMLLINPFSSVLISRIWQILVDWVKCCKSIGLSRLHNWYWGISSVAFK
jgi:hypothetical protein